MADMIKREWELIATDNAWLTYISTRQTGERERERERERESVRESE